MHYPSGLSNRYPFRCLNLPSGGSRSESVEALTWGKPSVSREAPNVR